MYGIWLNRLKYVCIQGDRHLARKQSLHFRYSSMLAYVKGRGMTERRGNRRKINTRGRLEGLLGHKDVRITKAFAPEGKSFVQIHNDFYRMSSWN